MRRSEMADRPRHPLSAYERLRLGASLHCLAAAARNEDPELADEANRWAALARRKGYLWEDEMEIIRAALHRYDLT
jgi:hypothetical protein